MISVKLMISRHHRHLLFSQRSEYESPQTGATHSYPSGKGTFLLKVNGDADDGGEVDEAEAEAGEDADSEVEDDDAVGRGGDGHPAGGQDGPGDGDQSAAIFVGEVAGDGTWKYRIISSNRNMLGHHYLT